MKSEGLAKFFYLLRVHKMKIVFAFMSFAFFLIVLFPFDDLSDLVTEKVAHATQNQVFLRFEHLGLAFFPPSLKMDKVEVDTPFLPTLKASTMTLAPSIARLLAFSPGASFSASNLFKGALSGNVGTKTIKERQKIDFDVSYRKFDLLSAGDFFNLTWPIKGEVTVQTSGNLQPEFTDQPEAEMSVTIDNLILPNTLPANIPFVGGTQIPQINFSDVKLSGRLVGGEFVIENGTFGQDKDPFHGVVKGKMQVQFVRVGNQVVPQFGQYEFRIDLNMDRAFESELQKRLLIVYDQIGRFKTATGKGGRYLMRVAGSNFMNPPNITSISSL